MLGYQQPCRYCDELIPPMSETCPQCGRVNPHTQRCPRCRNPVRRNWVSCSGCGLPLKISCPFCGEETFFGDYCDACDARLVVRCSDEKCGLEQPPVGDTCTQCGKPLETPSTGGGT